MIISTALPRDSTSNPPPHLLAALRSQVKTRLSEDQLGDYSPYPKQALFHEAGARFRQRLLRAGNQQGKTTAAGAPPSPEQMKVQGELQVAQTEAQAALQRAQTEAKAVTDREAIVQQNEIARKQSRAEQARIEMDGKIQLACEEKEKLIVQLAIQERISINQIKADLAQAALEAQTKREIAALDHHAKLVAKNPKALPLDAGKGIT
jgi:hypothetical protein